ncbi:hypothetical protein HDU93_001734, partial [Gonapodya sp. JEL0774]
THRSPRRHFHLPTCRALGIVASIRMDRDRAVRTIQGVLQHPQRGSHRPSPAGPTGQSDV